MKKFKIAVSPLKTVILWVIIYIVVVGLYKLSIWTIDYYPKIADLFFPGSDPYWP